MNPFWIVAGISVLMAITVLGRSRSVAKRSEPSELQIAPRTWIRILGAAAIPFLLWLAMSAGGSFSDRLPGIVFFAGISAMYIPFIKGSALRVGKTGIAEVTRFLPWADVLSIDERSWGVVVRGRGGIGNSIYLIRVLYRLEPDTLQELKSLSQRADGAGHAT